MDATQIAQIQDALANGAKVIVISPLDESTGKAVVLKAAKYHVPVIAYDAGAVGETFMSGVPSWNCRADRTTWTGAVTRAISS